MFACIVQSFDFSLLNFKHYLDMHLHHAEIRKKRKMGHITVVGQSVPVVRNKVSAIIGNEARLNVLWRS